jgi:acyl-CoA thioesterase YciA
VLSVYAEIASVGRTSMKIDVAAWSRTRDGEESFKVTHAIFTFVALDDDRRPRVIAR